MEPENLGNMAYKLVSGCLRRGTKVNDKMKSSHLTTFTPVYPEHVYSEVNQTYNQ